MRREVITKCNLLRRGWKSLVSLKPPFHLISNEHSTLTKETKPSYRFCTSSALIAQRPTSLKHYSKATCENRKPCCQSVWAQNRHYSETSSQVNRNVEKGSSALYIRRGDSTNVTVVDIDLDLKHRLADVDDLTENIRRRGLEHCIDIKELVTKYRRFSALEKEQESLEEERENIAEQMKFIVKGSKKGPETETQKRTLISRGKDVRDKLKIVQSDLWELEADVMMAGLGLPTELLSSTPDQSEILDQNGVLPEEDDQTSHQKIGEEHGLLSFSPVGPGACYLHGRLAKLELQLVETVSQRLRQAGLVQFSCPDMTKSLVMEGCGEDFTDPEQVLTLQLKATDMEAHEARGGDVSQVNKWDLLLNLCGGSSLPAIASFLCKMNIARGSLPLQLFSVGRFYKPAKGLSVESSGLLAVTQATQASVFAAGESRQQAEGLYEDYVSVLWDIYQDCGLPVRLVKVVAPGLLRAEGAATRIEAWLPSQDKYIKVAGVGIFNDFVSRRLMIKYSEDVNDVYTRNYVNMVYGTALDIPRLLAAVLENDPSGRKMVFSEVNNSTHSR